MVKGLVKECTKMTQRPQRRMWAQTERKNEDVALYMKAARAHPIRTRENFPKVSEWLACDAEGVDARQFGWSIDPRD